MNQNELKILCNDINAGQSPRWHRTFNIAYRRNKAGLPSNWADFTLREKIYAWVGIGA